MAGAHRAGLGGIYGLVAFLEEHCEAVEADLAFYAGPADQLHHLWAGGLSFRRLQILLDRLPPESATKTLISDSTPPDEFVEATGHGPWSRDLHMLAAIRDALEVANWQRLQANTTDNIPAPEPTPRPGLGATSPAADQAALAKARKYADRLRAGHGSIN